MSRKRFCFFWNNILVLLKSQKYTTILSNGYYCIKRSGKCLTTKETWPKHASHTSPAVTCPAGKKDTFTLTIDSHAHPGNFHEHPVAGCLQGVVLQDVFRQVLAHLGQGVEVDDAALDHVGAFLGAFVLTPEDGNAQYVVWSIGRRHLAPSHPWLELGALCHRRQGENI